MTVRALSGLVVLNLSYAVVGLSLLWALGAFRTWSAALRLAGLGYLLGLAAFGVLWTTLLVAGVPFGGVGIVVSLVVSRRSRGQRRYGAQRHAQARPCLFRRSIGGARHRGGRRARGALPRGVVPRGTAVEPPGIRRVGVLGAEGDGDLLLRRPRRACLHDDSELVVPAAAADPRRRGLPRDRRRGRVHAARAVLVPRRRCRRGCGRAAPSSHPRVDPLAAASPRSGRSSLRRAAVRAARRRPPRHPRRRRGAAARAVAPRLGRLAARGRGGAARRCGEYETRGHPLRCGRARRCVRRLGPAPLAPARRCVARRRSRDASVASLDRAARHRLGRAVDVCDRPAVGRIPPLVRRSLLERTLVGATSGRRRSRFAQRRPGATGDWPRTSECSPCCCSPAASGRRSASRSSRSPPTSRGTRSCATRASIVFLAAVTIPLLLASVWRGREEP